jgi:sugar O-acyltransferase (sialic acid O-acetyltransferase NeuD family)
MDNKTVYILGVGHSTPVSIDISLDCGFQIGGLYHYNDTRTGEFVNGYQIIGSFDDLWKKDIHGMQFVLSMGDNSIRANLLSKLLERGGYVPTMIHPKANVSRFAEISQIGVVIPAFCDIQPNTKIEQNVMLGSSVLIGHNTHIGENSFIACHSAVGAYISIGKNVFMGLNSTCISGKVDYIGDNAVIGAGCVVNKSVETNVVMIGNPCSVLHK